MGLLIKGQWSPKGYDREATGGRFLREASLFRHRIGEAGFPAVRDRYHLYVSYACPWAHRTLIFRQLKGLEEIIPITVVKPYMGASGWEFEEGGEELYGKKRLWEIYTRAKPDYTGRVTVPVLWDKRAQQIVNNESSEIIRMFNSAFNGLTGNEQDYYPKALRGEIDKVNQFVYDHVNNGVYKVGFATRQGVYEEEVKKLFRGLDTLEKRLGRAPYLVGERITEADWRLFTTLVRFDAVYYIHFKCSLRRIVDYPNLSRYLADLYSVKGIRQTVHMDHIKRHYYTSHRDLNPYGIIPVGPDEGGL